MLAESDRTLLVGRLTESPDYPPGKLTSQEKLPKAGSTPLRGVALRTVRSIGPPAVPLHSRDHCLAEKHWRVVTRADTVAAQPESWTASRLGNPWTLVSLRIGPRPGEISLWGPSHCQGQFVSTPAFRPRRLLEYLALPLGTCRLGASGQPRSAHWVRPGMPGGAWASRRGRQWPAGASRTVAGGGSREMTAPSAEGRGPGRAANCAAL